MKRKVNDVQRRILDITARTLQVPCSAHSLNLIVDDAAKSCLQARAFFDLEEHADGYFSASTRRRGFIKRHVQKR
jgi:hypothetical protein